MATCVLFLNQNSNIIVLKLKGLIFVYFIDTNISTIVLGIVAIEV